MKLIAPLERLVEGAAFLMFAVMFLLTLSQVLFRYFLQIPVPWTEEAARLLFVLATMSGIALAWRRREHIIVDFLFIALPPKGQRILSIVFAILILVFLALWARGAADMMNRNWSVSLITIGWFSNAWYYVWELAMIALLAVYVLIDLRDLVSGSRVALMDREEELDL